MADPIFNYITFNPFGLSDVGSYANPALVDIDGDGDLDAFVGNAVGDTLFFRNTGTDNPLFAAPITNPFGLSDVGGSPAFVDIDGDGDVDAFVGNGAGDTLFFRNTGTASNPVFSAAITNPFGFSDVGDHAAPTFADIDGDGDLDTFIGNYDGNTLFFRNTGTASNPIFTTAITNPFGLSDVGGYASPTFVDIDGDGDLDAFVGNGHYNGGGDTLFFRNTGTTSNPVFAVAVANPFGLSDVGGYASPIFVDIDHDNDLDAFVGNSVGNMLFFVNNGLSLFSTAGNDILTGTLSLNDTVNYVAATAAVTISLVTATQQNTIGAGLDTLTNIENLIGSNYNDSLTGNTKNNILSGGIGNDTLNGGVGADTMMGGLGNDIFVVSQANDIVTEKLGEGTDKINSSVTYTLPGNVENLTLTGALAINGTGNGQANKITGNSANNQLVGGAGNDTLDGSTGTNNLTGGAGNDVFKFTTTGHVDTITDYNVVNDTIQLENAVFTALTTIGALVASRFRVGTQAVDADDFIIYNSTTGALLYDANGNGAGVAVQIAIVGSGLTMTNADFVVI